jgi:hypothetical protein
MQYIRAETRTSILRTNMNIKKCLRKSLLVYTSNYLVLAANGSGKSVVGNYCWYEEFDQNTTPS